LGRCGGNSLAEYELYGFFYAQLRASESAIFQSLRDSVIRILVFLPNPYIGIRSAGSFGDLFTGASFFKSRRYEKRVSFRGQDHGEEAFATPPLDSGKVNQRCALSEQDCVNVLLAHQNSSPLLALCSLFD
jgi:hypothetical protein